MDELVERRSELRKRILTLEWDKERNQLNFGKNQQLDKLKEDLKKIENSLNNK